MEEVSVGLAWVAIAAVVGFALTAAAASFFRRIVDSHWNECHELELGYNAMVGVVDQQA